MASASLTSATENPATSRGFSTGYVHLDAMISAFAFSIFLRGFWHTLTHTPSISSVFSYGWSALASIVWKTFTAAAGFLFDKITAAMTSTLTSVHTLGIWLLETAAFTLVISLVGRIVLLLEDMVYKQDTKNSRVIKQLISAATMCATAYALSLPYLYVAGAIIANICADSHLQQRTTDHSNPPSDDRELQTFVGGD
jgi:hypothetical protein